MKTFHQILANTLISSLTNGFVWFALTFWAYLETQSVMAVSFVGGSYLVANTVSAIWFGSLVDHHRKKNVMLFSTAVSLIVYAAVLAAYLAIPKESLQSANSPYFWLIVIGVLVGVIFGNIRNLSLPPLVTMLVPEDRRDKANGLSGTIFGLSFTACSFISGALLAYGGLHSVLGLAVILSALAFAHLLTVTIDEKKIVNLHAEDEKKKNKIDIRGTLAIIAGVPGLFGLIFFNTLNNLLGGVYMALMDAYGLSLVSVQVWGVLWGLISFSFIFGGLYIAKKGLGSRPLHTLMLANMAMWFISIFFAVQPSIVMLTLGMAAFMILVPFVEAAEQTILQRVVPLERQGRVFGLAQTIEGAASPVTAFLIGPIAQLFFIPFMTDGAGVNLIGGWFGTGPGRGIALVFVATGIIGLIITYLAYRSRPYRLLSRTYAETHAPAQTEQA